jgi:diacylglycerol kinase (ATP)
VRHLFIINPAAGKFDHTEVFTKAIDAACKPRGLDYEICISAAPGDCRNLARRAAESGEEVRLYACGGDGTLNEVVCGAAGFPNAAVTHYPGGSGNDWIKVFSDPAAFRDIDRLLDGDEAKFDLIRFGGTYALNILSVGLDARIGTEIAKYKRIPGVTGSGAYIISAVVNLLKGLSAHFSVTLDGEAPIDGDKTLICACNGRWYGGGFNPVPDAEPDDGLLDVLMVDKVSLFKAAGVIGRYKKGRWRELPEIIAHRRCKTVRILCDRPTVVNVDGEAVKETDVQIELAPQALRFFYPKGLRWHAEN